MTSDSDAYEVRCPRCDVSFPIETRVCVHCGGRTSAAGTFKSAQPIFDFDARSDDRMSPAPNGFGQGDFEAVAAESSEAIPFDDHELGTGLPDASETPSVGRSILGSMGSLIWIVMLIAFSLSGRVCAE